MPSLTTAVVTAPWSQAGRHRDPVPPPVDTSPGHRLVDGRYRTESVLGRGGMADVVLASDIVLGRDVALKLFRSGSGMPADEQRFALEARVLASLSHPNLVTVFDAGIDVRETYTRSPYLVMEYVAGPTVAELIASGAVDHGQVAALGAQVASALDCVHQHGVVHRDVKPGNILLTDAFADSASAAAGLAPHDAWTAKLTDFGIARVVDSAPLTVQGLTIGTATYLSPEQARGEPAGPASDVYSLALVLLELLTGRRAFEGAAPDVAYARLCRPPEIPKSVGRELTGLLRAMTANDPERRPSAKQVFAALHGATLHPARPGRSVRSTRARWAIAGGLAAGVAAAVIAIGTADFDRVTGVASTPSIAPTDLGAPGQSPRAAVPSRAAAAPSSSQRPATSAPGSTRSATGSAGSAGPPPVVQAAAPAAPRTVGGSSADVKSASHGHSKRKPLH